MVTARRLLVLLQRQIPQLPSVNGVRHSPTELTPAESTDNGASVLLHTILAVDASNRDLSGQTESAMDSFVRVERRLR